MINYEWDAETVDIESGDVIEHFHTDTFAEAQKAATQIALEPGQRIELVLVRDVFNEVGLLKTRLWAYVEDGKLPEWFTDSAGVNVARVPKRFHAEIKKAAANG